MTSFVSGTSTTSYVYDGDGRRVKKTVGGVATVFVYNASGQLIAEYGQPQGEGGTSYLTSDHLGSTRLVTDATGVVKARHDYLPFGEELNAGIGGRTTAMGYDAADTTRQRFTSKERDTESGLDYFLARYYSSAQGRFLSPDEFAGGPDEFWVLGSGDSEKQALSYASVANPQSLNKFQYCFDSPLRYVDPDGHDPGDDKDSSVLGIWTAYTTSQIKGGIKAVAGSINSQMKILTDPKGAFEDIKQTLGEIKETIKTDIEVVSNPKAAADAIIRDVKEDPKMAAEVLGDTSGQVAATVAMGKVAGKIVGSGAKASSSKLGQRGGVGIGSSKTVRVVAKSNPSETSVNVIVKGKRVLEVGRHQVKPGKPKQFHFRIKNGPHRGSTGRKLD
jgi:RHS repeat-associated protein